jgi:hypothetical protein
MRLIRVALLLSLACAPALALTQAPALEREPSLVGQAPAPRAFQSLADSAPPLDSSSEGFALASGDVVDAPVSTLPSEGAVGASLITAVLAKRWGPALSAGLLLLILLVRRVGSVFFPALATGKGAVWLTVGAGTLAALVAAWQNGDPSLVVLLTAAASGFWSWAQSTGLLALFSSKLLGKEQAAVSLAK